MATCSGSRSAVSVRLLARLRLMRGKLAPRERPHPRPRPGVHSIGRSGPTGGSSVKRALCVAAGVLAFATPALGAVRPYDFDGDGRQELAAGLPDLGGSGAVLLVRTGEHGLRNSAQFLSRSTPGVPDDPHGFLGGQVVSGDFNGDGYADLAPAGSYGASLLLVYGSSQGLDPQTAVNWGGGDVGYYTLAAGDVDGDGFSDLAASETHHSDPALRAVEIFRGGPAGLSETPSTSLHAKARQLKLADLDRDGRPELLFSGPAAATACRNLVGGPVACSSSPARGTAWDIAAGDVTGGRNRELVLATANVTRGGSVAVYGLVGGELSFRFRVTQSTPGVPGRSERGDQFGTAVDVGRIGRRGKATIVVGARNEDGEGRVTLGRGARHRVARHGNRGFGLDSPGVPGSSAVTTSFGERLALLDHNGDGRLDLDVGAPSVVDQARAPGAPPVVEEGSARVIGLLGARRGLTTRHARAISAAKLGLGEAGTGDL